MRYKAPKGTQDLLPSMARSWDAFLACARDVFTLYGYEPVETPIFEQTELFVRGLGEDTDAASKEIFTVYSMGALQSVKEGKALKAAQQLSLRPEGTASVVRAIAEHNLVPQGGAPSKLYYYGPMFRAERPQKGRLRQFHQLGVECLGATDAASDAEMIIMCMRFFEKLGIPADEMTLLINSMGDETCRPAYEEAVRAYEQEHIDELCDDCRRRVETNPLRSFDCKNPQCYEVMEGAPRFSDNLCEECNERFSQVKSYLDEAGIKYTVDPRLVRGFDYYTGTVFEVQVNGEAAGLGSQSAIGGGGRYDKLMGEVGDRDLPGLGFAVGFERIMLVLEAAGIDLDGGRPKTVYVASVDASVRPRAFGIVQQLRDAGIAAVSDTQDRSLKSQFKVAGKSDAALVVICGPDELAHGEVTLRDMQTHEEVKVACADVVNEVRSLIQ